MAIHSNNIAPISVVYVTFPDIETAQSICTTLLREKHIACANLISQVHSLYISNDSVKEQTEVIGILKTSNSLYYDMMMRILEIHPYSEPCIIQLSQECKTNPEYAAWANKALML